MCFNDFKENLLIIIIILNLGSPTLLQNLLISKTPLSHHKSSIDGLPFENNCHSCYQSMDHWFSILVVWASQVELSDGTYLDRLFSVLSYRKSQKPENLNESYYSWNFKIRVFSSDGILHHRNDLLLICFDFRVILILFQRSFIWFFQNLIFIKNQFFLTFINFWHFLNEVISNPFIINFLRSNFWRDMPIDSLRKVDADN